MRKDRNKEGDDVGSNDDTPGKGMTEKAYPLALVIINPRLGATKSCVSCKIV